MRPDEFVINLIHDLEALPTSRTAPMRRIRREYSKRLETQSASYVMDLALSIICSGKHRWIAYELIQDHPEAFQSLDREALEKLGQGINSWSTVDSFARTLSGPAWRDGLISSDTICDWARSQNRWWRRAA